MKNILYIGLSLLIGIGATCVWFGCLIGFSILIRKCRATWVAHLTTAAAAIPLLIVVILTVGLLPRQRNIAAIFIGLGVAVITALLCAGIVCNKKQRKCVSGVALLWWGLDGVLMEIPQRLMMQSLLFGLLQLWKIPHASHSAILCTAVVWCIALLLQNRIQKQTIDRELLFEIAASLVFSLGIGWVYQTTGLLLLAMFGHLCERMISNFLLRKKNTEEQ